MRHASVAILVLAVLVGGCAGPSSRARVAEDAAVAAAPGPDLVGTWSGTVFAVTGSHQHTAAPVELTINADGTWSWSKRGALQGRGHVVKAGPRVLLKEDVLSQEGAERIELEQRGTQLYGLSRAFIPGAMNAVQLQKVHT